MYTNPTQPNKTDQNKTMILKGSEKYGGLSDSLNQGYTQAILDRDIQENNHENK